MQAAKDTPSEPISHSVWSRWDTVALLTVLFVAVFLRAWHLTHTEVAARDSIGFIRIAWRLKQAPVSEWPNVIRESRQHPGYPLAILAMSSPVEAVSDASDAYRMQWAAQIASALASILLVIPTFLLGRELFDRRVGFGTALVMQCLPVAGRIFADGLSEGLFLLFAASSLLWATRALKQESAPGAYALTGLFSALAYLVRPEGLFIVLATGLVLLVRCWRSWKPLVVNGLSLSLASLALVLPYVLMLGALTAKPTGKLILRNETAQLQQQQSNGPLLAVWMRDYDNLTKRSLFAINALIKELVEASFYFGWLPLILGLWWFRGRFREVAGLWVMLIVSMLVLIVLWRVALLAGYLSSRHTLLAVFCFSFWTVVGLMRISQMLFKKWGKPLSENSSWALILPVLFAMTALPKTMKPLHQHRAGFRQVGEWLSKSTHPIDQIVDPFCWSHYYAGRVFLEGTSTPIPEGYQAKQLIVMEEAGNPHRRLSHLPRLIKKVEKSGRSPVYTWEGYRGRKKVKVHIYALDF